MLVLRADPKGSPNAPSPRLESGAALPRRIDNNLALGYVLFMTWGEVVRKLKAAGFVEVLRGKGSHRLFMHPATKKEVWVAVHTKKDAGQLGNRILREAGIR